MRVEVLGYKNRYKKYIGLTQQVADTVVKEFGLIEELEVSVSLVSKFFIRAVNKFFRNNNKATDVLSFPTLPLLPKDSETLKQLITRKNNKNEINPVTTFLPLGDLLVCMPVVKKHAKAYGNSMEREFAYMIVHGMLHLLGYDHIKEQDKKQMRKVEERVLNKLGLPQNK